jgi:thiamine-phosphate pyrophosphorylase
MDNKIDFRLLLISNRNQCKNKLLVETANIAFSAGIKAIQLREKDLSSSELLTLAKKLRKASLKHSVKLIINDRLDIAILVKADGVHSPEKGIQAKDVKRFNKNLIAGKSTHSVKSAIEAEIKGYDCIIAGPVFRTASKIQYGKPLGMPLLKEICGSVKIPVFAVGGINPKRAKKCIDAGAYGVAVISAIFKSENIKKTVLEFKNSLGGL